MSIFIIECLSIYKRSKIVTLTPENTNLLHLLSKSLTILVNFIVDVYNMFRRTFLLIDELSSILKYILFYIYYLVNFFLY